MTAVDWSSPNVAEDLRRRAREDDVEAEPGEPILTAITIEDLLSREFPPRENVLDPWLPEKGLAMVHAWRGVGKTFFGLEVAYAVASGGKFLQWSAKKARRVLYIDGEMPAVVIQERLAEIAGAAESEADESEADESEFDPENFKLLSYDLSGAFPDLSNEEGQRSVESMTGEADLIVVDNVSTCFLSGRENTAEDWAGAQAWALRMRVEGRSVLLVHHDGKGGYQRGSSKKEDVLDTVIQLKRPADYEPQEGARFEIHFTKNRGLYGEDVEPFEAMLHTNGNREWRTKTLEQSTFDKVVDLFNMADGELTQGDIAQELEINKSQVSRHLKRARELGLLATARGRGK